MRKRTLAITLVIAALTTVAVLAGGEAKPPEPTATDKVLAKMPLFTKDDPWRKDISKEPVDPLSTEIIAGIGAGRGLHPDWGTKYGIPFQFVDKNTPRINPKFDYADETDKGPYPLPENPLIEGVPDGTSTVEGDRHILCIDTDTWRLYELYHSFKKGGVWQFGSGAIFDLTKSSLGQRPNGWTSADAAGLPIFPGLVRFDEVGINKVIPHAIRFTVVKSRKAYVSPATHWAARSNDPKLAPMGMRVRLKADYDISKFPPEAQVVLICLKKYGMIMADNGSNWFITGAPDPRWNDDDVNSLKRVKGSDLEVVKMENIVTR